MTGGRRPRDLKELEDWTGSQMLRAALAGDFDRVPILAARFAEARDDYLTRGEFDASLFARLGLR